MTTSRSRLVIVCLQNHAQVCSVVELLFLIDEVDDLEQKDISEDKFDADMPPGRRVPLRHRAKASGQQLRAAARSRSDSWNRAVAHAIWRAEEIRAARRPFDMAVAATGFEPNPFRWQTAGWLSHTVGGTYSCTIGYESKCFRYESVHPTSPFMQYKTGGRGDNTHTLL